MAKLKFKIGDVVIVNDKFTEKKELIGRTGIVKSTTSDNIAVEFGDIELDWGGFHDCGCGLKKGRWINPSSLELDVNITELKKENEENKEVIKNLTKELKDLTKKIKTKNTFETAMTEAIIEKGKEIAVEEIQKELVEKMDTYAKEKFGLIPKTIEIIKEGRKPKHMEGLFHKEFETILKVVDKNIPLMLIGPAGSGKNYALEQTAKALNLDFYFTNAITQEYKLTGFIDANGVYHETEFYKAFTKGGLFFLDEMDASCAESLLILNSAIANGYFDFPNGRENAHKNFRVVAAANTYGTGADMIYVGRNVLDGATLDRFVVLNFDYDEEVEKALSLDEDLFEFITSIRKAINENSLRYIISMRATINATKLLEIGIDKATILKNVIIKNMSNDDLNTIIKKINYSGSWKNELKKVIA